MAQRMFLPSGDREGGERILMHPPKSVLKGFKNEITVFPVVRLCLPNHEVYIVSQLYENVVNLHV